MPSETPSPDDIFHCTLCGECCRGYGGTYVTEGDIAAIAAHIDVDPERFRQRYCRPSGRRLVLGQRSDGFCHFFDGKCSIHPVKPRMCRRWPFIPAVLADPANWSAMAGSCPGMRTDVPLEMVTACVRRVLEGEKA